MPKVSRAPDERMSKISLQVTEKERKALFFEAGKRAIPVARMCREIVLEAINFKTKVMARE